MLYSNRIYARRIRHKHDQKRYYPIITEYMIGASKSSRQESHKQDHTTYLSRSAEASTPPSHSRGSKSNNEKPPHQPPRSAMSGIECPLSVTRPRCEIAVLIRFTFLRWERTEARTRKGERRAIGWQQTGQKLSEGEVLLKDRCIEMLVHCRS